MAKTITKIQSEDDLNHVWDQIAYFKKIDDAQGVFSMMNILLCAASAYARDLETEVETVKVEINALRQIVGKYKEKRGD
jgi:hypothetical protein